MNSALAMDLRERRSLAGLQVGARLAEFVAEARHALEPPPNDGRGRLRFWCGRRYALGRVTLLGPVRHGQRPPLPVLDGRQLVLEYYAVNSFSRVSLPSYPTAPLSHGPCLDGPSSARTFSVSASPRRCRLTADAATAAGTQRSGWAGPPGRRAGRRGELDRGGQGPIAPRSPLTFASRPIGGPR